MTTEARIPQTDSQLEAVSLHVADLKPQQHAICVAVWRAWADGRTVTIRDLSESCARSYSVIQTWIVGLHDYRTRAGLVELGLLAHEPGLGRTLRPGPRMAGVHCGKVLVLS